MAENEALDDKHKSNLSFTGFNYVNSIIGSGMIGIPYALYNAGLGTGILLLIVVAYTTDYSLCLLIEAGNIANVFTYQELVQYAYGKKGFYLLTLIQISYPIIAMTSYNVIIGDTLPKIIMSLFNLHDTSVIVNRYMAMFLGTIFITLPLSLFRDISRLAKASLLSLLLVFGMIIIFIIKAVTLHDVIPVTPNAYRFINSRVFQAIGMMACAFMCHHNSFLLYNSMKDRSQKRWNQVTHVSIGISFGIIVLIGVIAYLTFTGFSQGDILVNFCENDDLANIARFMFMGVVMLTYPIELFVTREVIKKAIFYDAPWTDQRHNTVTIIIVICIFILSCVSRCLKIFLEMNGVFIAVPLAYIIPSLIFLKVNPESIFSCTKLPSWLLIIFGVSIVGVGCVHIFQDIVEGITCIESVDLPYCHNNFTNVFVNI